MRVCKIKECQLKHKGKGYCQKHYARFKKYGDPHFVPENFKYGRSLEERFWSKVEKSDNKTECWNWKAATRSKKDRYGIFRIGDKNYIASRVSWKLSNGKFPPKGIIVRHTCDNPLCVNPNHLKTGTTKDNSEDMVKRDRSLRGQKHHNSKIADTDAIQIIELLNKGLYPEEISKKLNIPRTIVSSVKTGKSWAHLEHLKKREKFSTGMSRKIKRSIERDSNLIKYSSEEEVIKIINLINEGFSNSEVANQFKCNQKKIRRIRKGETWKELSHLVDVSYRNSKYAFKKDVHSNSIFSNDEILKIIELLNQGISTSNIANKFGCSKSTISAIKNGQNFKHLYHLINVPKS